MSLEELVARLRGEDRPLPRVTVEHGRAVPGWVLRVAFVLAVPAFVLLAASRTAAPTGLVATIVVGLTAWALLRPGAGTVHTAVVVGALLMLGAPRPFDPAALWLAVLGYAVVRLGWWASHTGLRARVEVAALGRAAARDAVVAGATAVVGLLAWAVAGRPVGVLVALGTAALAAVAWLALRHEDGGSGEPQR
jgi:hypothetical protein